MNKPLHLSLTNLDALPSRVGRPRYKRSDLRPGIVHIGVGNFHRAHQAVYLDRLFEMGQDHDWAVIGAGVRETDNQMRARLSNQDFLTTIVELAPEGHRARVLGNMIDFVPVESGHAALIEAMTSAEIRIVSLTVTEGGYYLDAEGAFDAAHPDIAHDAAHPAQPITAFGAMLEALRRRREQDLPPFTVLSCDNIPGNGTVTRNTMTGLARLGDAAFAAWVRDNVSFPNGMVDRITPATAKREIELVGEEFGIDDAAPVLCEPFMQWVLEDDFRTGRPALEKAGVIFTDQVHAFETMKIRVLNGGHAVIAYVGGLLGIRYAHEAMQEPLIASFLRRVEEDEILPNVPPVPQTDLHAYLELIEQRFANADIGDTIRRLCFDGSNRQPKFIVPSLRDNINAGRSSDGLALVSALWCRYCYGETEEGVAIEANDPNWEALMRRARTARNNPAHWLAMREIYGDLGDNPRFAATFSSYLTALWRDGTRAVLARYLQKD